MPSIYELQLPVTPKPTPRARLSKHGHAYSPADYRVYLNELRDAVAERWGHGLLDQPIAVTVLVVMPRPKSTKLAMPKPDWDNYGKGVCDAMHGVVYADDTIIRRGSCEKAWGLPGEPGRIHVIIEDYPFAA